MARFAARHKGLLFEDKGASFAIHYRRAPALASFVHRTLRRHAAHASIVGWHLRRGKGILELRPEGRDKGTAIVDYLREPPFDGRKPVFVGDDYRNYTGHAPRPEHSPMLMNVVAERLGPELAEFPETLVVPMGNVVSDLMQTLADVGGPVDFMLVDIWTPMARPALELVAHRLREGAVVICDNTEQFRYAYSDYFAFVNDPANKLRTMTLPFEGGLEFTVRCG